MRTILAAVDQSHHAHDVMSRAAELAVVLPNDLVVLSVISSDPMKQFNIVEEQNRFASLHRELIFKHFPENSLAVEPHSGTGGVYKYGTAGVRIQSRILSGNVVDKICERESVTGFLLRQYRTCRLRLSKNPVTDSLGQCCRQDLRVRG